MSVAGDASQGDRDRWSVLSVNLYEFTICPRHAWHCTLWVCAWERRQKRWVSNRPLPGSLGGWVPNREWEGHPRLGGDVTVAKERSAVYKNWVLDVLVGGRGVRWVEKDYIWQPHQAGGVDRIPSAAGRRDAHTGAEQNSCAPFKTLLRL